jgi:hypothetical protein
MWVDVAIQAKHIANGTETDRRGDIADTLLLRNILTGVTISQALFPSTASESPRLTAPDFASIAVLARTILETFLTMFNISLRQLKQFKLRCGHCNVPARWSDNPALATWVGELRRRGKGKVPARWKRRLNVLEFEWAPARAQWWETRFRELEGFKKQFGHCNVPKDWPANLGLGNWVSTQRTQRAHLSPQRRRRLERLGFCWQVIPMSPRKTWEDRFQELIAFHVAGESALRRVGEAPAWAGQSQADFATEALPGQTRLSLDCA